jgi:hypothetical protein
MKLTEKTNHFILGRSVVSEAVSHLLPDLVDSVLSVHQPDEEIGGWSETLDFTCRMVLENVPELPAIVMAMNFYMASEARFQGSDSVPRRTIKRTTHNIVPNSKSE